MSFQFDSTLPRDAVSIHPHFGGSDPAALAAALKTNLLAQPLVGPTVPFTIKVYDAQKPKPNPPLATVSNATGSWTTNKPRELALCLSYYTTYNQPRYRGRLFIPAAFLSGSCALRPTAQQMTDAMAWSSVFRTNLPAAHNWVLYSPTRNEFNGVSNWWVDDEWDVVRSRGLRGVTRQTGQIP